MNDLYKKCGQNDIHATRWGQGFSRVLLYIISLLRQRQQIQIHTVHNTHSMKERDIVLYAMVQSIETFRRDLRG